MYVVRYGVNEGLGDEFRKIAYGALGSFAGFGISEFTSEYIVKAAKISDAIKKLATKILVKAVMAAGFAFASYMTGGVASFILMAAGMGCAAGILYDIVNYVRPGAFAGLAEELALSNYNVEDELGNLDLEDMTSNVEPFAGTFVEPTATPSNGNAVSLYS